MMRVYSYFYPAPELTNFMRYYELTRLRELITQLGSKEEELRKAMQAKGGGSVDYQKFSILHQLLGQIEGEIAQLNAQAIPANQTARKQLLLNFVNAVRQHVQATLDIHIRVLKLERNNHKFLAKTAFNTTTSIATLSLLYMAPITFIFKPFLLFGTLEARNDVIKSIGMFSPQTKSMLLFTALRAELSNLHDNLTIAINPQQRIQRIANDNQDPIDDADRMQELYILYSFSAPMNEYIKFFENKPNLSDLLDNVELTAAEEQSLEPFIDPILLTIPNRPVYLEGKIYDLDALLAIPTNPNGARNNPFTRTEFFKRDLQPARDHYNQILGAINLILATHRAQPVANR